MRTPLNIHLADPDATTRLGHALARILAAGDCVCLAGDLGAGKSHLARSIIHALQAPHGAVEHVPSPTYTLIQTYDAGGLNIVHADLYRLGDSGELTELGLEDAFDQALCLVEWPERMGDLIPDDPLWIALSQTGDTRQARLSGRGWGERLTALRPVADV